jgi:hypothetical protein
MKIRKYIFLASVILAIIVIYIATSLAQQRQRTTSDGQYQLVPAQYEDNNGNVHPVVYRIDTKTGETHRLEYTVQKIEGQDVRFQYFGQVYNNEIEMLQAVIALQKTLKNK